MPYWEGIGIERLRGPFDEDIVNWEHIRCKLTSSCKPCKLQSEPPDQHSRGNIGGVGGGFAKV